MSDSDYDSPPELIYDSDGNEFGQRSQPPDNEHDTHPGIAQSVPEDNLTIRNQSRSDLVENYVEDDLNGEVFDFGNVEIGDVDVDEWIVEKKEGGCLGYMENMEILGLAMGGQKMLTCVVIEYQA